MKRLAWAVAIVGLLILDWAALHDILAGEPEVWQEWAILGLSAAAYALLLWKTLDLGRRGRG